MKAPVLKGPVLKGPALKAAVLLAVAAALGLAAPACAKDPDSTRNCFQPQDWQAWRGADAKTIYVRVHNHDIWRIDLSAGSDLLTDQTSSLSSHIRTSGWVCGPTDIEDFKVSNSGVTLPLFVKAITRLTPEQAAALPAKDRP